MSKKVISFTLDYKEIDNAIKQVEQYRKDLLRKLEELQDKVAARLAEEAQRGFNGAVVDDLIQGVPRYANVDVNVDKRGNITVVIADGEDAVWVEFGAGVYHNGTAGASPHPNGAELGFTIGGYGKGFGKKEVWGFYEDDTLRLTHGTPAKMPMALAVSTVCNDIAQIAKEVFG